MPWGGTSEGAESDSPLLLPRRVSGFQEKGEVCHLLSLGPVLLL